MNQLTDSQLSLIRRYREIMPIVDSLKAEKSKILSAPYRKVMLIRSQRDIFKEVAFTYFLNNKLLDYVRVINCYELVEVFLGNSSKWKSLYDVTDKLIVITIGYHEMENKRMVDILNQFIEMKKKDETVKCLLLFYKGDLNSFNLKYGSKASNALIPVPRIDLY